MNRRRFLFSAACFFFVFTFLSTSSLAASSQRVQLLKELTTIVESASVALTSITGTIKDLVIAGKEGYDAIRLIQIRDELIEISADTASILASHTDLLSTLREYASQGNKVSDQTREKSWKLLIKQIEKKLIQIYPLLQRIEKERSNFVLDPSYQKLFNAASARAVFLSKFAQMPPPKTKEELAYVEALANQYEILIQSLTTAREDMNKYVKSLK